MPKFKNQASPLGKVSILPEKCSPAPATLPKYVSVIVPSKGNHAACEMAALSSALPSDTIERVTHLGGTPGVQEPHWLAISGQHTFRHWGYQGIGWAHISARTTNGLLHEGDDIRMLAATIIFGSAWEFAQITPRNRY